MRIDPANRICFGPKPSRRLCARLGMTGTMVSRPPRSRAHPLLMVLVSLLLSLGSPTTPATEQLLAGRPAAILQDGGLLLIASDGNRLQLRLAGIETPLGPEARLQLRMLVLGKPVRVVVFRRNDQRGIVGRLLLGGTDAGLRLLTAGLARHRPGEVERALEEEYRQAQEQARSRRLGIWSARRR